MNWTTGDVIANGIKLHYVRTGGAKPPLVMAHGHSDNALCWVRVAKALEADYDCIMFDARRHGLSDDGPEGAPREAMVHDAAALIGALGLSKPGMIGHSMGAATSAGVGALYPDLLGYIILEDPPWFEPPAGRKPAGGFPRSQEEQPTTRQGWVERGRKQSPHWHEDEVQAWADSKIQFYTHPQPEHTPPRGPWQEVAAKITARTLLLTGDVERGAIVSAAAAQEAMGLMARGQWAHIPGAGHCIHRDQFDAAMAAIRAFLV